MNYLNITKTTGKNRAWVTAIVLGLACSGTAYAQSSQDLKLEKLQQQLEEVQAQAEAAIAAVENMGRTAGGGGRTTVGGYAELHYNNLDVEAVGQDVDLVDFHRFVIFLGHQFNDRIRFYSELEVEHAFIEDTGGDTPGEVELEQAYVEFSLEQDKALRAGMFLLPIGIMNETHEPPTYYGVERNDVEGIIIPSTWWEAGVGLSGSSASGLGWDIALHSGLKIPTTGGSAFRVRSGRQKVAKADASNLAATGRIKYTGTPGLELALSVNIQNDPSQVSGDGLDDATLTTAHVIWTAGDFQLRALYGTWDLSGAGVDATPGADTQDGFYLEPSYKFTEKLGVYARLEDIDAVRAQDKFEQFEAGFNYWPHPDVVVKFSYRDREQDLVAEMGRDFTGFDLGIGVQF